MEHPTGKIIQRTLAVVGAGFGIATIVAGSRVLLGADPGYVVYRPLLAYNTAMGAAYLAAGILAWMHAGRGMIAAALVFLLNAVALASVVWLRATGEPVARESLGAMVLRTVVWLVLWAGLAWVARRGRVAAAVR